MYNQAVSLTSMSLITARGNSGRVQFVNSAWQWRSMRPHCISGGRCLRRSACLYTHFFQFTPINIHPLSETGYPVQCVSRPEGLYTLDGLTHYHRGSICRSTNIRLWAESENWNLSLTLFIPVFCFQSLHAKHCFSVIYCSFFPSSIWPQRCNMREVWRHLYKYRPLHNYMWTHHLIKTNRHRISVLFCCCCCFVFGLPLSLLHLKWILIKTLFITSNIFIPVSM